MNLLSAISIKNYTSLQILSQFGERRQNDDFSTRILGQNSQKFDLHQIDSEL